ncbi:MAG: uroporphyrinogen-III synthase [Ginsengibacter sp.]
MRNDIQILCTKKISDSFIEFANENNIRIDSLNFIETEESVSDEIKNRVIELSEQNITAIFTSSNAVNAVGKIVKGQTNWKIFCIEPSTKKTVEDTFLNLSIVAVAKDAEGLSQKIIKDKSVKQVVFFCGNQRRDLLHSELNRNGIDVEELIVYNTIENPQTVSKTYDGILFFSPSAVRSFFAKNNLKTETTVFTIGKTTAAEVKKFSNNTIVISDIPDTGKLINEVIKYFNTIKTV